MTYHGRIAQFPRHDGSAEESDAPEAERVGSSELCSREPHLGKSTYLILPIWPHSFFLFCLTYINLFKYFTVSHVSLSCLSISMFTGILP